MYAVWKTRLHTYTMGSAGIVAFILIIAWTSIIVVGQNMASIHVAYESSATYVIAITFNASVLQKFHSCLCDGSAANCVAQYELIHYTVIGVTAEGRVVNSQISRTYKCTHDASQSNVICEQQRPQDLPDFSSGNVRSQSFLITQQPCGFTCIVFIWQFQTENMTYDNTVGVVDCKTNCACQISTTAAVTSPATTSQISPIPIQPKTTEAASKTTITTPSTAMTAAKTPGSTSSSSVSTPLRTGTTNNVITAVKARTTTTTTSTILITKEIPKTTKPTTSISNVISNHYSFPTTAVNLGNKTSDGDTPVGGIVGVVIGVIIIIASIIIGITIWRRRRATLGSSEKMHREMDIPTEFSDARTLSQKSKNNMDTAAHIAKNGTNSIISACNQQCVNEKNAPDHEYANVNLASVNRSNFRKRENNTMAKENVSGHKGKQPQRNTADDDISCAFADDPPDQEKSQKLHLSIALSPQSTGSGNKDRSGHDYGYASVDDVDVFARVNGGTSPDYENWIENTLQNRKQSYDSETKRESIPSTVLAGNINNSHRSSGGGNYGDSYTDQEFSKGSKATSAFGRVNACGSGNSDYEYPVMENDYDSVSVNSSTQINDNPDTVDTTIDDDNRTTGSECHLSRPSSDAGFKSKNVDAKLHNEQREMDNPYNNLLSLKEDPTAIPSQNNLLDNQSARYSNLKSVLNAFSNRESDETIPVTDVESTEL